MSSKSISSSVSKKTQDVPLRESLPRASKKTRQSVISSTSANFDKNTHENDLIRLQYQHKFASQANAHGSSPTQTQTVARNRERQSRTSKNTLEGSSNPTESTSEIRYDLPDNNADNQQLGSKEDSPKPDEQEQTIKLQKGKSSSFITDSSQKGETSTSSISQLQQLNLFWKQLTSEKSSKEEIHREPKEESNNSQRTLGYGGNNDSFVQREREKELSKQISEKIMYLLENFCNKNFNNLIVTTNDNNNKTLEQLKHLTTDFSDMKTIINIIHNNFAMIDTIFKELNKNISKIVTEDIFEQIKEIKCFLPTLNKSIAQYIRLTI